MDEIKKFHLEREERIRSYSIDKNLSIASKMFSEATIKVGYSYNFSWLGRPIIQYPQDMIALQEIIWDVKPDLIVETGIAHGGSLVFNASMLSLLELSGLIVNGQVIGIDIDIRKHNKIEIEKHPMANKIKMLQGSSTDESIIKQVYDLAKGFSRIIVCLDSNHTHGHVLAELRAYASLVSVGSYCIVFDTIVENLPDENFHNRPWRKGNNPKTAVWEFLKDHREFEIDENIEHKLLVTVAPGGYLKRIS